ncbi:MAG: winged helix-turn-helix domain-containing protein [Methanoregulaceae archaeon]|nr:winged helix-turn-helix domain-containing protein [Methanoregulaceae archaeon]
MAFRIEMFGGLAYLANDATVSRFRTKKTAALLAYLAYHPRTVHTREELVELLWPESDINLGRQNLSTALSSLRRQLEPPGMERDHVLLTDRESVALRAEALETDVQNFESALKCASKHVADGLKVELLESAIELYRGPLLPHLHDDWIIFERERLHEDYCAALRRLSQLRRGSGDLDRAISLARKAIEAEPLLKDHYAHLALLLQEAGDMKAADRVRRDWEQVVQGKFDRKPRETALTPKSKPVRAPIELAPMPPPTDVPVSYTRFFGREAELRRIVGWIQTPGAPMLTLTGPGGIGKSRLASESLRTARAACCYIPLADLRDPTQIPVELARALGVPPAYAQSPDMLGSALRRSGKVLFMDNFEHIREGAVWLEKLLLAAPDIKVLITSQHCLGLDAESEMPIAPLSVPDPGEGLESLAACPSIALFVDRAQRSRPDFQITRGNAEAVRALCDGLEGIPLAIELAAARAQVLTPAQMQAQLSDRFSFLVNRKRPATERHRTMEAALQWSYDLLREDLQRAFVGLCVFRGGWSLEAAAAVLNGARVADTLEELVAASLVNAGGTEGGIRFSMLETVRAFGELRLPAEERGVHALRHVEHYVALAESAAPHLMSPAAAEWLPRLSLEQENFRAALEFSSDELPELGMRLSVALAPYWNVRANASESRKWLAEFLGRDDPFPTPLRMAALFGGGTLCVLDGEFARAEEYLTECLAFARDLGDEPFIASVLEALGTAWTYLGLPRSVACFDEALHIADRLNDPFLKARLLLGRGIACLSVPDFASANEMYEQAHEIATSAGLAPLLPRILTAWGVNYNYWHRPEEAEAMLIEASKVARESGDFLMIPICDWGRAIAAHAMGDLKTARRFNADHLNGLMTWGIGWGAQHYLECESRIELTEGNVARAATLFAAMMALRERSQMPFIEALSILYRGLDGQIEELRHQPEFAADWQLGKSMNWEQAVAFATSKDPVPPALFFSK